MSIKSGPFYEVTFFVDPVAAEAFDLWLENHVSASLGEPGMVECNSFPIADDDDGRARRVCLHVLESDAALDAFLDGRGTDIDTELVAHFPQQAYSQGRVLREDQSSALVPGASPDCLNCGTRLKGQYCGNCGQRSRSRLISLWELIADAFGDLFEIDSRLWQTLIPLLIRPGRLTHDYLQGRRARYMPPFRMYLVLSLLFFVVAFFDPHDELGLLFEPQPELTSEEDISGDGDDDGGDCNIDASDLDDMPDWLARRVTVERMQRICEKTQLDDGRALVDNLLDNIPAALIVLLPLMAFVLKVLYPLSKRYYVEHLLFFVHFHAFFFLILSLQILFARLSALLRLPEALVVLTLVITSFYVPVYLFVSMRRVYGQGRTVTLLKYVVLLVAYLLGFFATMLGALAIAAFSI